MIPHVVTITGALRHFKYDDQETGGDVGSFYCKQFTPTTYFGFCKAPYGTNISIRAPNRTTPSGNRARGNLSWHVTDRRSFCITPGHRASGQGSSIAPRPATCRMRNGHRSVTVYPAFTVPDNVTNNEIGWKTEWFDHRLQFNGAVYQEIWSNAQTGFFDPQGGLGNLAFATNGPSYRVRGVEPSVIAR